MATKAAKRPKKADSVPAVVYSNENDAELAELFIQRFTNIYYEKLGGSEPRSGNHFYDPARMESALDMKNFLLIAKQHGTHSDNSNAMVRNVRMSIVFSRGEGDESLDPELRQRVADLCTQLLSDPKLFDQRQARAAASSLFLFDSLCESWGSNFDKVLERLREEILNGTAQHTASYNDESLALIARAIGGLQTQPINDAYGGIQALFWDIRDLIPAMGYSQRLDFEETLENLRNELRNGETGEELSEKGVAEAIEEIGSWIGDDSEES